MDISKSTGCKKVVEKPQNNSSFAKCLQQLQAAETFNKTQALTEFNNSLSLKAANDHFFMQLSLVNNQAIEKKKQNAFTRSALRKKRTRRLKARSRSHSRQFPEIGTQIEHNRHKFANIHNPLECTEALVYALELSKNAL